MKSQDACLVSTFLETSFLVASCSECSLMNNVCCEVVVVDVVIAVLLCQHFSVVVLAKRSAGIAPPVTYFMSSETFNLNSVVNC